MTYVPGQIDVHCGSGSTTGLFSTLLPVLAGIAGTGIGAGVTLYTSRVSDKNSREREAEERQFRHAAEEQSKREERLEELFKAVGLFSAQLTESIWKFGKQAENGELGTSQTLSDGLFSITGNRPSYLKIRFLMSPDMPKARAALRTMLAAYELYTVQVRACAGGISKAHLDAIFQHHVPLNHALNALLSAIGEERHGVPMSEDESMVNPSHQ